MTLTMIKKMMMKIYEGKARARAWHNHALRVALPCLLALAWQTAAFVKALLLRKNTFWRSNCFRLWPSSGSAAVQLSTWFYEPGQFGESLD